MTLEKREVVSGAQQNTIAGVLHRLQRPYTEGEHLAPGEFVEAIRDGQPELGVYRAIPLGTMYGGNLFQKVESYLRIKLANLKTWLRS